MEAYVKSFATYRTIQKATVISSALTLDSLEADTTTVTVVGTGIGRSNTGDWLLIEGNVYKISNVKPQGDRTLLTLVFPQNTFTRPLELEPPPYGHSIGMFIRDMIQKQWIEVDDPAYAMPYLQVSSLDTTPYVPPELDGTGCYIPSDYFRLMRKTYRVSVKFVDIGTALLCIISRTPEALRQIDFSDGRSQLQSVDYSSSGTAKLTVLCDVDTGVKDAAGEPILERQRSVWYLSEDGKASQTIPARRASGEWKTIHVKNPEEIESKVVETFAKNKANHKLEFWSSRDLAVQDDCTFVVYGEVLQSYISYKRKSSEDKRFYYKSGELATTATEKLRGVVK